MQHCSPAWRSHSFRTSTSDPMHTKHITKQNLWQQLCFISAITNQFVVRDHPHSIDWSEQYLLQVMYLSKSTYFSNVYNDGRTFPDIFPVDGRRYKLTVHPVLWIANKDWETLQCVWSCTQAYNTYPTFVRLFPWVKASSAWVALHKYEHTDDWNSAPRLRSAQSRDCRPGKLSQTRAPGPRSGGREERSRPSGRSGRRTWWSY